MIRVAAVGDVHYGRDSRSDLKKYYHSLEGRADLLLIAGDLTQRGLVDEAAALAGDLREVPIPMVAVLGNHDYHSDQQAGIRSVLEQAGVTVLEGESAVFEVGEVAPVSVGIVGIKGFGGGFGGACCTEFGEAETKAFARHAQIQAEILERSLRALTTDFRFVLMHYSPVEATLLGEKREIYPFLGSYLLAEAVDVTGADCIFHGHAHMGSERGKTPGGVPVRNVAQTVIRHAYNIYTFDLARDTSEEVTSLRVPARPIYP